MNDLGALRKLKESDFQNEIADKKAMIAKMKEERVEA